MKFYNPFKPHIIQDSNGLYWVRRFESPIFPDTRYGIGGFYYNWEVYGTSFEKIEEARDVINKLKKAKEVKTKSKKVKVVK